MSAPATHSDVILRDGRTLRLRPPVRADRDLLAAFFGDLSPESLRLRFFSCLRPDAGLADPYLDPDWAQRGALIGTFEDHGRERVVALASYARLRDPRSAEVAFAVADSLQGVGVGARMLEQLAERATSQGIEQLVFEILAGNAPMLRVVSDAGFTVTRATANGVIEATMSIEPSGTHTTRVDERDHRAVAASSAASWRPRAWPSMAHRPVAERSEASSSATSSAGDSPAPRTP